MRLEDYSTGALLNELRRRRAAMQEAATEACMRAAEKIIAEVALAFGVRAEDMLGRSRVGRVSRARQVAMCGLVMEGYSLPQVGAIFGRHHTTVLWVRRKHMPTAEERRASIFKPHRAPI